jgi:hypothetical protein
MGRFADALRRVSMPEQTRRKILSLDEEFSEAEAEMQALKAENLHLKAQVNPLQREVDQLKERVRKAEEQKPNALTFNSHTGLFADASGLLYCPTCLGDEKRNPLKTEKYGWRCMVGGHFFSNPDSPPPIVGGRGGRGGPNSWMAK